MEIQCKFTFKYPNKTIAKKMVDSLEIDNLDYVKSKLEENIVIVDIKSSSFMSLLHTVEDYLSCLATAENILVEDNTEK
jgi:hypothetical protein